jgi:(p)ppGpp synthase/HD superfamily hydrolase
MPGVTEEVVAAAWLHDVIEDCDDYRKRMLANFPKHTVELVIGLTNPSKTRTDLKRAERKALDREHIAKGSYWVKVIKLIDRIDNIRDMGAADAGFRRLYGEESLKLLHAVEALPSDGHLFDLKNELMNELTTFLANAA